LPWLRPQVPLFPLPLLELSRLGAESLSVAAPRQERRPQWPAGVEQPERLSQEPVRLKGAWAVDELLLTVAEREAVAAEWELGKASLARSTRLTIDDDGFSIHKCDRPGRDTITGLFRKR
jgi:hypothetical protein